MRRFLPAAAHAEPDSEIMAPPEQAVTSADHAAQLRSEDAEGTSHAQRIVKELFLRYQKQLQRWRDYRTLFAFLGFVALFLAILYTQRQANTAFQVHSTLADVLVPSGTTMGSTTEVYAWLQTLLDDVWVDPKCGDGLCEAPFEFASYSRFGCRADCGKLQDVQDLTKVQVDVYFDFSHPIGSMPASDLMQQTSWNLCPTSTAYSSGCYYDTDVQFDRLTGATTTIIADMPDGNWDLVMRRDIFMKTSGAVRDFSQLNAVSYYYRVYLAALSALAEQNTEMMLLTQAVDTASMTLLEYVRNNLTNTFLSTDPIHINSENNINMTLADFYYGQLINATCGCNNIVVNATNNATLTWAESGLLLLAFNNSLGILGSNRSYTPDDYNLAVCAGGGLSRAFLDYVPANFTVTNVTNSTTNVTTYVIGDVPSYNFTQLLATNSTANYTQLYTIRDVSSVNPAFSAPVKDQQEQYCRNVVNKTLMWRTNQTGKIQRRLIDYRLGDSRTTGKIAARNLIYGQLRNTVIVNWPEFFDPIFTYPSGSVALSDMVNARVDVLQEFFVLGPYYFTQPQPAYLNITRRVVYALNVTTESLKARAIARLNETRFQQMQLLNVQVPVDPSTSLAYLAYPSMTIQELILAFSAALGSFDANSTACLDYNLNSGCMPVMLTDGTSVLLPNGTLPNANSTALNITAWSPGGLQTSYNLITWQGGSTAYMSCNLDLRGPTYLGVCTDIAVTCVSSTNDTVPYNCTLNFDQSRVAGNLASVSYRETCEGPCDRQMDCNTLCECYGTCGTAQYCSCSACTRLTAYASNDVAFVDITNSAITANRNTSTLADMSVSARRSRALLQDAATTAQLNQVITQVSGVQTQQTAIATQMTSLQQQVTKSNELAQARANDNTLIDLITAGRQDIQAGQARVEAKLDQIIGTQTQSLAAAEAATTALAAIQNLATKQLAAQQALEKAVQNQLTAIKAATFSGVITLSQALSLWKRARRDQALTLKAAQLANVPCNPQPTQDNTFVLQNGNLVDNTTSRERNIGLTNRVITGLLLHQTRTNDTNCTDSKFSKIQQTCTGPTTLKSFGVDPVFKRGTSLYNADYDDSNGTLVLGWYNCSLLSSPTYQVPFQNTTSNPAPYCAELYNSQKLPYAFHYFPMEGKAPGFPMFFDINLAADGANRWETYIEEGLYLDSHTRTLTADLVTYNAPLRIFGYFHIVFEFSDGGSIKLKHALHTVRVELYNSYEDSVRFAFEIILTMIIFCMMGYTLFQMLMIQKQKKNFLLFFSSGWNWVEFISNGLLTACMIIWWIFVTDYAKKFDTSLRHDVYTSQEPLANFLALSTDGEGLAAAWQDMDRLSKLIDMLNWYFALNGINILLLIARVLRLMDFQPRLGVVTRSLWLAGPDLIHFAIVAGMVFVGYAMMAHLIFGNAIEKFQTFGDSVNTCFEILLGNIDVNNDLRALGGLQSVAGALFFWSYELLVFMVLLNFLLAIIVDAFSEVKEKTHETVGIHTELFQLMRDKWRGLLGSCSKNYISDDKLGALLKQWAGDEDDDKKDQVQGDVQKLLTILDEDLDEEDLRNVLLECLKDAPTEDTTKVRTGLARFLPQRRKVVATPDEVTQAAKYIVDRFGVPVEAEEDLYGDGGAAGAEHTTYEAHHEVHDGGMGSPGGLAIDKERDQLAGALERLADVQKELADGQRNLMTGQRQLAEQQAKLVGLMNADGTPQ